MRLKLILVALLCALGSIAAGPRPMMAQLSDALSKLMPYVVSPSKFEDPGNRATIKKQLERLTEAAGTLHKVMPIPDDDPSIAYLSGKLHSNLERSKKLLAAGYTDQARSLIKTTTYYCIACHTRTDQGATNLKLDLVQDLSAFSTLERAEFFAATRNFDEATKAYEAALADRKFARRTPHRWEAAATRLLAITVRIRRDPRLTQELIAKIRDDELAPARLRAASLHWWRSAKEWLDEPKIAEESRSVQLTQAKRLYDQGTALDQDQRDAGLIYFLRASTRLHELLRYKERDAIYGTALYYARLTAEKLMPLNFWTLHSTYFEACVRFQPHTQMAKDCYTRFEKTQLIDDVNAAGRPVYSEETTELLKELKKLAS